GVGRGAGLRADWGPMRKIEARRHEGTKVGEDKGKGVWRRRGTSVGITDEGRGLFHKKIRFCLILSGRRARRSVTVGRIAGRWWRLSFALWAVDGGTGAPSRRIENLRWKEGMTHGRNT